MKKFFKCLLLLLLSLNLFSCTTVKRYITYTVYPIGYLLDRIGQGKVETITLQSNEMIQTATIVDNYQEILDDTSYFFHIGDLEPYLDLYKEEVEASEANIVDLSVLNAIYKFGRYTLVNVDGKESFIESPYYNGEVFNTIDTTKQDLCLWLDPIGMLSMAKDVYSVLSSNYVEQASFFKENYEELESELIYLDVSYQKLAKKIKKANLSLKFVTMSASFGSWQKAYGFQVYPLCLSKYGALPSNEELAIIKQRIVADGVKYIVFEPNMSDDMVELFEQIEKELNLERITLSNLSSLTATQIDENKDYMSIMYENLNVLEGVASAMLNEANSGEVTTPETNSETTE